jgi:hypothetical protein
VRSQFEVWEPVGQGRTLARPVGKRVRIGRGLGNQWERVDHSLSRSKVEDWCSSDMQERERKGMALIRAPRGPADHQAQGNEGRRKK